MRVRILSSALDDLAIGREFYERQAEGIGDYFFDSLFSDIDSLSLFGGSPKDTRISSASRSSLSLRHLL
jgi:hypothetical protein